MKFAHYFSFTWIMALAASLSLRAATFTLQGNIKGLPAGQAGLDKTLAYLDYTDDANKHHTDSVNVISGQFTFTGNVETPTFGILYFSGSRIQENFFFEPGTTSVTGDTSKSTHLSFSGGASTALFKEYRLTADSFNRYRDALVPFISGNKANKDSALHAQYMDDFYLSMSTEESRTEDFIRKHPESYVSAYLLYYKFSGEGNINKGIALLHILNEQVQRSKYIALLLQRQLALKKTVTGFPAPDFSEPDSAGKTIKLSNIKAQYVLLDFWASWCGPCRRENPALVNAYQKYHNKGFEIISLSFDQNRQPWVNAIRKDSLSWLNVCGFKSWDDEAALMYGVAELPTNFLIDKSGVIVAKNLMGTGLDYELEQLLGK
jgi:thiol-disulfide isomerase/thioredoxin